MTQSPIIILGAGGHTKVLIDVLLSQSKILLGITDPDPANLGENILSVPVIGDDYVITAYNHTLIQLVNGVGTITKRQQLFNTFKSLGYKFASVVHDFAMLSKEIDLCEGVQIMAGSVIQPGSKIGTNSIINSRVSIDHDTIVGSHVHVAPGATISGGVQIGDGVLIGAGATIIQGIKIGSNAIVAAGAVVIEDVPDGSTVMGVPARVVPHYKVV